MEGYLSLCDEDTANSVVRVAAVGYFENTVAGKNYRAEGCVFLGYFYNLPQPPQSVYRQIKIKIDPFTNVYHTWNVHLATSEQRGACNIITNNVSFQPEHTTQQK